MPSPFFGEKNLDLPNEVLVRIFSFLNYHDMFWVSSLVCKIWYNFVKIGLASVKSEIACKLKDDLWYAVQNGEIGLNFALNLANRSDKDRKVYWSDAVLSLDNRLCKELVSDNGIIFRVTKLSGINELAETEDIVTYYNTYRFLSLEYSLLFSRASRYLITNQLMTFKQMVNSDPYFVNDILSKFSDKIISLLKDKLIIAQDIENCSGIIYRANLPKLDSEKGRELLRKKLIYFPQGMSCHPYVLQIFLSDKVTHYLERQLFTITDISEYISDQETGRKLNVILEGNGSYCLETKLLTMKQMLSINNVYDLSTILSNSGLSFIKENLVPWDDIVNLANIEIKWRHVFHENKYFYQYFKSISHDNGKYCLKNKILTFQQAFFNYCSDKLGDKLKEILSSNEKMQIEYEKNLKLDVLAKILEYYGVFYQNGFALRLIEAANGNVVELYLLDGKTACSIFSFTKQIKKIKKIIDAYDDSIQVKYDDTVTLFHENEIDGFIRYAKKRSKDLNLLFQENTPPELAPTEKFSALTLYNMRIALKPQTNTQLLDTYLESTLPAATNFLNAVYYIITASENPPLDELILKLRSFLVLYAKYTHNKGSDYFQAPFDSLNRRCLAIASAIARPDEPVWNIIAPRAERCYNLDWMAEINTHYYINPQYYILNSKKKLIPILFDFLEFNNTVLLTSNEVKKIKSIANEISENYFNALEIAERVSLYGQLKKIENAITPYHNDNNPPSFVELEACWNSLSEIQKDNAGSLLGEHGFNVTSLKEMLTAVFSSKNNTGKINLRYLKSFISDLLRNDYCWKVLIETVPTAEQGLLSGIDLKKLRDSFEHALNNPGFSRKPQAKNDLILLNDLINVLTLTLPGNNLSHANDVLKQVIVKHQSSLSIFNIEKILSYFNFHQTQTIEHLMQTLPRLSRETRAAVLNDFIKSRINSNVTNLLDNVQEDEKLTIARMFFKHMSINEIHVYGLVRIINFLPEKYRFNLIKLEATYIKNLTTVIAQIEEIIAILPDSDKIQFIASFIDCIKLAFTRIHFEPYYHLEKILNAVKKPEKIEVINMFGKDLTSIIPSNYSLCVILAALPSENHLVFVRFLEQKIPELISSWSDFKRVANSVNPDVMCSIISLLNKKIQSMLTHPQNIIDAFKIMPTQYWHLIGSAFLLPRNDDTGYFTDTLTQISVENRIIAIKSCFLFIRKHITDAPFLKTVLDLLPEKDWHVFATLTKAWAKNTINKVKLNAHQTIHIKSCFSQADKTMSCLVDAKASLNQDRPIALQIADIFYSYAHPPLFSLNWRTANLQKSADNIANYLRRNHSLNYDECKNYILTQTKNININPYGTFKGILYQLDVSFDPQINYILGMGICLP